VGNGASRRDECRMRVWRIAICARGSRNLLPWVVCRNQGLALLVVVGQSRQEHLVNGPVAEQIVVGVFPGQPDAVVAQAAALAHRVGAELVCAWADGSRYTVEERPDGSVRSMPIDPDIGDTADRGFPPALTAQLARILEPARVGWTTRELAGDPAGALGRLADLLGASMIVVGTREAGMKGSLQEFFAGSTAVHLAHRQHRPVVVIPLNPIPLAGALPWESE
jgi:nucleotide-binding universal stress UspA family protein